MTSRRHLLAAALGAAATAACGSSEHDRAGNDDERRNERRNERRIERYLDAHWPQGAGGTVVAAREGEAEPAACEGRGLADREAGIAAACDTVYDIGSVTKSFTAAAIVRLEMTGRLDYADPLAAHLPPAADVPDDKRGITLHHLLTHTSGLPEGLGDDYDPLTRDAMVAAAMDAELRSEPGAAFRYSNTGYSLLAAVVETASGMGYEEYLVEELFTPAGMADTGYTLPEWEEERVAVEYDRRGRPQGRPYEHPWAEDGPYWNLRGNGGLLTTARDMHRWYRALAGEEILDRRAKELMFTPHVPEPGGEGKVSYGYGWDVFAPGALPGDVGTVLTHNGGNDWSYARNAFFPDLGVMVFWVSNHAYRDGRWNIDEHDRALTLGLAELLAGRTG
ncbi:serine hydrolase domain-containing protein [Streptomyces sp. 6N223]|uniref:serine hydrolase domain-containing protein n=1 Tax=Streptomyces sp. 6N223 TaxID=3457412 RepID=UPI003FD4F7C0